MEPATNIGILHLVTIESIEDNEESTEVEYQTDTQRDVQITQNEKRMEPADPLRYQRRVFHRAKCIPVLYDINYIERKVMKIVATHQGKIHWNENKDKFVTRFVKIRSR